MYNFVALFDHTYAKGRTAISSWELYDISNEKLYANGPDIVSFFDTLSPLTSKVYCRELDFYGLYLLDYLIVERNLKFVSRAYHENEVDGILGNNGIIYKLRVTYKKYKKSCLYTQFINFSRLLPYNGDLTEYFGGDQAAALCRASRFLSDRGDIKITLGSNALDFYKKNVGLSFFNSHFPQIPKSTDILFRPAYRGGLLGCNEDRAGKIIKNVWVYDINSLYGDRLRYCLLPYGEPLHNFGEPKTIYPYVLWIAQVKIQCKLKDGYIPCISIVDDIGIAHYISDTGEEDLSLTICSADFESIRAAYDITSIEWGDIWYFKGAYNMFNEYVDIWSMIKEESPDEHIMHLYSKLMLNNLIGKFATKWEITNRLPYANTNRLGFDTLTTFKKKGVYLPVAIFVNAYARQKLLGAASAINMQGALLYWDTDCVVIEEDKLKCDITDIIEVDAKKLGAWKAAGHYKRFLYRGTKVYAGEDEKCLKIVYSGLNRKSRESIKTIEDFIALTSKTYKTDKSLLKLCKDKKEFFSINKKIVPGGAIYVDTPF